MINNFLISLGLASAYYLLSPIYLRLRHYSPRLAVVLARIEQIVEFAFLVMALNLIIRSL